jgi:hypothetical protein
MSLVGQNPNLPRRSIAVRFTLNKQIPTGGVQYEAMCQEPTYGFTESQLPRGARV